MAAFECIDDEMGTRLKFDNASDALFARLFLKAPDGISLTFVDTILSTIRNPAFNAKQLTFNSSAEFFTCIAQIREKSIVRCENEIAGLPEIVLRGVIDVLGDELQHNLDLARRQNYGYIPSGDFRGFSRVFRQWRNSLVACSLVHSSWLAPARLAVGKCHRATQNLLYLSLKSPWIGGFTQELHLHFQKDWLPSLPFHTSLLRPLFLRLPNLQRLNLSIPAGIDGHESNEGSGFFSSFDFQLLSTAWYQSLPLLPDLEELTLQFPENPSTSIRILSEVPLPKLKTLRFLDVPMGDCMSVELPAQFSPIRAFPSLQSVHLDATSKSPLMFLMGISWSKPCIASLAFALHELRIYVTNQQRWTQNWSHWQEVLHSVKHMCVWYGHEFIRLADRDPGLDVAIQGMFSQCSSVRSLSINGRNGTMGITTAIKDIPKSVEELHFMLPYVSVFHDSSIFDPSTDHTRSRIEEWDALLASVLLPEESPNLRIVRAHIDERTAKHEATNIYMTADRQLYSGIGAVEDNGTERRPLLPRCLKVCDERGIPFSLDALLVDRYLW